MNIALIPARGGSQRIPRKNVKSFCGRPMIAWSIERALESGLFAQVLVSTDDEEIAAVAEASGASAPFRRPAELADHHTPTRPVVIHALDWLHQAGVDCAALCCLYATAPFVTTEDLRTGAALIDDVTVSYAFAATDFGFPVQRGFTLEPDGSPRMLQPAHAQTRSQDLPAVYHDAGQFYWARPATWRQDGAIFGPAARPVLLPRHRVQDIDTPDDWLRAEGLMRLRLEDAGH